MKEPTFFIVWSPQGAAPPKHRHADHESAVREAERLASIHRGSIFYVLQATTRTRFSNVETVRLYDPDDELPF